jgi:hypothetical protein
MRDNLLDIVKNTYGLGIIDLVKIVGTDTETAIEALAEDRSVIVKATMNKTAPDFKGTFGMPNLGLLSVILNLPEYKENAKIELATQERNGEQVAVGLNFENGTGNFKNTYRFMSQEIVTDKLKSVKMRDVKWNVEFEPSMGSISMLKSMAAANPQETTFVSKTEGDDLKFYFGDHSSHAGDFVFHAQVGGTLSKGWAWPVGAVIGILGLTGNKKFSISDEGAAQITVNTGITTYNYILPAQSK